MVGIFVRRNADEFATSGLHSKRRHMRMAIFIITGRILGAPFVLGGNRSDEPSLGDLVLALLRLGPAAAPRGCFPP